MGSAPTDLPQMEYRFLGRSGLQVSAIALGGWLTYGGHVDDENTFACLKAAYDAGINFFDCAEGYAGGESERVMGRAIKYFKWLRNDIVVSTKINWGQANSARPAPLNRINHVGLSRKHIIEGTNAALERLQLDYVDIVYAHRPDRQTPVEETVRAFNHLIDTGKAFYWGTSEWPATEIEEAWALADRLGLIGPIVEQPGYNAIRRERVDEEYANARLYTRRGLGLTIYSPLANGLLTGKYINGIPKDSRLNVSDDPYVKSVAAGQGSEKWDKEQDFVRGLIKIAERLDTKVATLALAWVISNENVSSAITGASRPEQLWETVRAVEVKNRLTKEILEEIDELSSKFWKKKELVLRFS